MTTGITWITPGTEAVILQPSDRGSLRAETVTIDRVLKRDVVLSNSDRFRLADTNWSGNGLSRRVGGTWGHTIELVHPDDPRVAETRAAIHLKSLKSQAHTAFEDWRRGSATASDVAEAFNRLTAADNGEQS